MKYQVLIRTLTPLHIGNGDTLIKDYDFFSNDILKETYILNQDTIYGREFDANGSSARLEVPAASLLSTDHFKPNSPFVRYTIQGYTDKNVFGQQIKDVYGQAYIPGSSLKGAIRTAFFAYAIIKGIYKPDNQKLRDGEKNAATYWEKDFFGDDPTRDWMRALQISDSKLIASDTPIFTLVNARVETGENKGSPVVVEAINRLINFESEITIDEMALKMAEKYPEKLNWKFPSFFFSNMIAILKDVSNKRIAFELKIAQDKGLSEMKSHYEQMQSLIAKTRESNTVLLQLGWGTGWTGTTIGPWLVENLQKEIRKRYKLGKPPTANPWNWEPNLDKPFPQSRRLQMSGSGPGKPLGWVALTFTEIGKPTKFWMDLKTNVKKAMVNR